MKHIAYLINILLKIVFSQCAIEMKKKYQHKLLKKSFILNIQIEKKMQKRRITKWQLIFHFFANTTLDKRKTERARKHILNKYQWLPCIIRKQSVFRVCLAPITHSADKATPQGFVFLRSHNSDIHTQKRRREMSHF